MHVTGNPRNLRSRVNILVFLIKRQNCVTLLIIVSLFPVFPSVSDAAIVANSINTDAMCTSDYLAVRHEMLTGDHLRI